MDSLAIVTFVFFTALVAVIAWWKTRKEDLSHGTGYFLGGRSLSWIVIAGSLILTNISTEQMVGMNGGAYANGVSVMAWEVVAVVAMVAMAWFFLPRYLGRGISTIPQYIEMRFGSGIRVTLSAATLFLIITGALPFVLYSGALFFDNFFDISHTLGLNRTVTLYILCLSIGLLGGAYSVLGGLKAVAVSDTINGVGLLIGGMIIPFLALAKLGEGSIFEGLHILATVEPERLSPLADPSNDEAVPFSALFTGMLLINVSYWCMGQFIVQRTFGAKSMKDGQKGILFAAFLKLVGVTILVLPGLVAYHLLDPATLSKSDDAYSELVKQVLPVWLNGFFAAVVLGAVLSSFNSALHASSTMFGLDVYQKAIRKNAPDSEAVLASKIVGLVLMFVAIGVAPLIGLFGEGLFAVMKKVGSGMATPMAALTFAGIFLTFISGRAALISMVPGIAIQSYFVVFDTSKIPFGLHWLHFTFANFVFMLILMTILSKLFFPPRPIVAVGEENAVDMTWSRAAVPAGILLLLLVVGMYAGLVALGKGAAVG